MWVTFLRVTFFCNGWLFCCCTGAIFLHTSVVNLINNKIYSICTENKKLKENIKTAGNKKSLARSRKKSPLFHSVYSEYIYNSRKLNNSKIKWKN